MARAVLSVLLLLIAEPAGAQDGKDISGRPLLPNQFFGVQARFETGGLIGHGAGDATQPLWAYGGSFQIRLLEGLWLEFSGEEKSPFSADAPADGFLLVVQQQGIGLRIRKERTGGIRITGGVGGGAARQKLVSGSGTSDAWAGGRVYAFGGFEKEIFGTDASASYLGGEVVYDQYFFPSDAPFRGGSPGVRMTFSYYFGGDDASDCW